MNQAISPCLNMRLTSFGRSGARMRGVRITQNSYTSLGRLAGALRNHANDALRRLSHDSARSIGATVSC